MTKPGNMSAVAWAVLVATWAGTRLHQQEWIRTLDTSG